MSGEKEKEEKEKEAANGQDSAKAADVNATESEEPATVTPGTYFT